MESRSESKVWDMWELGCWSKDVGAEMRLFLKEAKLREGWESKV